MIEEVKIEVEVPINPQTTKNKANTSRKTDIHKQLVQPGELGDLKKLNAMASTTRNNKMIRTVAGKPNKQFQPIFKNK